MGVRLNLLFKLISPLVVCLLFLCSADALQCIETEREALIAFKQGLTDPSKRLSSWVGEECCNWAGIICDNRTAHVTSINLSNPLRSRDTVFIEDFDGKSCLGGNISSSLLQLEFLNYLDLSLNYFRGIPIPPFFGMLKNLRYLNLASASFAGEIPPQLGNLTRLQYLDLNAYSDVQLTAKSLHWLSGLSSLDYLNLGSVMLYNTSRDWLQTINKLPSLLELHLPGCDIEDSDLDLALVNFTSLRILNMSTNFFRTSFPTWVANLTSLEILDLSLNELTAPIPGSFCNLQILDLSGNEFNITLHEFLGAFNGCPTNRLVSLDLRFTKMGGELPQELGLLTNLQKLDLSANFFWGSIPTSIGNLLSLKTLDLSENEMNGTIPESLGQLFELVELNLELNKWSGTLTETHLKNLTRLESIKLENTDSTLSLVFNVTYDWFPPFMLKSVHIENCMVGPAFAAWLQSQDLLTFVVLKNTGISDMIPTEWFATVASQATYLDLSENQIRGELPHHLVSPNLTLIDLSSNRFEGPVPVWSTNANLLDLRDNLFSGSIPENLGELMPSLLELDLSGNLLNGSIPTSICQMMNLSVLSLRGNRFSGQLPDCWNNLQKLWALDASNNNISGEIPESMGNLRSIHALLLSNNDLQGEIPTVLRTCSALMILDLGGNRLSGNVPAWMGESLSSLLILLLGSNFLTGNIPPELCSLAYIHFLDLSHNNISGNIPSCINELQALANGSYDIFHDVQRRFGISYDGHVVVRTKGRELEYSRTVVFVNGMDLSGNHLSGEIPDKISTLYFLGILNLSRNDLSGSIPKHIGNIRWLETLDLSHNHLSGPIPQSLSSLTSLAHLNLSYNNLTGRIPSGSQLQTLKDSSIYMVNPLLCGVPLLTKCPGDRTSTSSKPTVSVEEEKEEVDSHDKLWFYVSVIVGFVVGFWGFCGPLLVKSSWRYAYFKFLDNTNQRISVMIS
ncbi:leucine-rich repeat receptor protein kinase MSL1 [Carica papaya]|uniref:leucine-rich repeat receptor protein kinase MSL1 n=1 Tax=Carica papaya TaxID=3649 RepID=UPI000B8CE68B|nr:leucine-rich repeat receptor protein kinase MSL1 [Carica papaya]XP_021899960.1 leucine-rich repeat receptor protein kinase MSL1 [Carica papaya]